MCGHYGKQEHRAQCERDPGDGVKANYPQCDAALKKISGLDAREEQE